MKADVVVGFVTFAVLTCDGKKTRKNTFVVTIVSQRRERCVVVVFNLDLSFAHLSSKIE